VNLKIRIVILFLGVLLLWILLLSRAAYLQIFPDQRLTQLKERQYQTLVRIQPRRGSLLDRNHRDLAVSVKKYSIYADPKLIEKPKRVARKLSKLLKMNETEVFEKIKNENRRFVWLSRRVDDAIAKKIENLNESGVGTVEDWSRIYPNESLLGSTLGAVGGEGQGLEGLELKFDHVLRGEEKKLMVPRDARGRPLLEKEMLFAEEQDGKDVKLTIDSELQYFLETELKNVKETYGAESALGIVLDPKTSAVLALANVPGYNPNQISKFTTSERRNRSITDIFEPGSTLKPIVVAGAMNLGLLEPNTQYFCENGEFQIGKRVIREAEAHEKFKFLTVSEIISFSSNIGMAKMALQMGDVTLNRVLSDFGMGQKTNVDYPGEARGIVQPLPWPPHTLATNSFGQGIAATPLQIANAYAVIANGGILHQPYFVDSVLDIDAEVVQQFSAQPVKRVVSEDVARKMRMILMAATSDQSTGKSARVPGYLVAGKTGTAQKVKTEGRGYDPGKYISSFAGFAPANDPQFVIYVAVDSPQKEYYGSVIAAPLFSKVAAFALKKFRIAPSEVQSHALPLAEQRINNFIKTDFIKPPGLDMIKTTFEVKSKTMPEINPGKSAKSASSANRVN